MSIGGFIHDDIPTAEVDRLEAAYGPLAAAVRELVDATIRTTVPEDEVRAAQAEVEALVTRLRARQLPGPAGVRFNSEARSWSWGNAVIGLRNAIAPPLQIVHPGPGRAYAAVTVGAAYEGPPGLVHGGVAAMLLDHIMGETASSGFSRVTFTGTLTMTYRRGTPLGDLRLESHIDREEGRKVWVVASISDSEGVTVEAEGVFIVPAWAAGS
ncbi:MULTISPECIES: PaaI family thioesterase [unclassified Nocardioides]|uniref:PaaI family thioesterase n=1 Tax=unclassified Nocardioides TaxID=2615069 RepID=UPI00361E8CBA